ncbi:MAG: Ig-like domain-containing protein [Myxococcota bacterium]
MHRILLVTLAACTSEPVLDDASPDVPMDPEPAVADTTAPRVVATTPDHLDDGVLADTIVTITFSEAMDTASVEAALEVTGEPSFDWNTSATELSIELPLTYADAPAEALVYTVTLDEEATDEAGNGLEQPLRLEFRTAVRHTTVLANHDSLFGNRYESSPDTRYSWIGAGDGSSGTLLWGVGSWIIADLPSSAELVDFEAVTLTSELVRVDNDPAGDFGAMRVERVSFDSFTDGFVAPSLGVNPTPLIPDGVPLAQGDAVEADLTPIFGEAWDDGAPLFQIRVAFEDSPNTDGHQDAAYMSMGSTVLTVSSLTR